MSLVPTEVPTSVTTVLTEGYRLALLPQKLIKHIVQLEMADLLPKACLLEGTTMEA